MKKMANCSATLLRVSMAAVFLWFSITQFLDTTMWEGLVPLWITNLGISAHAIVLANATFEVILGTMLLFGIFTRWVALLLALHLAGITISLGYNPIAVRDFGLTLATFSIFLNKEKA